MKIKLLNNLLSPLKDSTVSLSASNTPTIHYLFAEIFDLHLHHESCTGQANAMMNGDDDMEKELGLSIKEACDDMLEKWR